MTRAHTIDPEEIRTVFAERGVVRLDAAFDAERAAQFEATVWNHIEARSVLRRDDPSTWTAATLSGWKGLDRSEILDALIGSALVRDALDAVERIRRLDPDRDRKHRRPHEPGVQRPRLVAP